MQIDIRFKPGYSTKRYQFFESHFFLGCWIAGQLEYAERQALSVYPMGRELQAGNQ